MRALHGHGFLSRTELWRATGLTRSAVRVLIGELVAGGLVDERNGPPQAARVGRRRSFAASGRARRVLALEVAVDSLAAALVGLGGRVLAQVRVDRPRDCLRGRRGGQRPERTGQQGAPKTWRRPSTAGRRLRGLRRRGPAHPRCPRPGPEHGLGEVPLGDLLAAGARHANRVMVANEADLGALAEQRRGAGRGVKEMLFISGEVGVGGGLIVDGRPIGGATGYGGEIGHMPLNPAGGACGCGSSAAGSWRSVSGAAGAAPDTPSTAGGARSIACSTMPERYAAGTRRVRQWAPGWAAASPPWSTCQPATRRPGRSLRRVYRFVEATLAGELKRFALAASRGNLRVSPALLGVDAPLMGAAELAFEPILDDPAAR